ncbi:MAG: hypothetical protein QOK39_2081 [Acidimicrobiaceae bacterium]|jgi:uncharacterized RmlC-like cupin family protein|nr:hypothetical protein [Acidimicrobiaceae bacterium]
MGAMADTSSSGPPDRLHHVPAGSLSDDTAQTAGMRRREAVAGRTVGSTAVWMGETRMAPGTRSGDHHHGDTETAIYVVAGHPRFVFRAEGREVVIATAPGDYVFVPPWVPHREENPSPDTEAVVVIARSSQDAVVVNLAGLGPLGP